jgi:hypothetical protein
LKGVSEGPSPQNEPREGINARDATVLVFVTKKGSPAPLQNSATPTVAPAIFAE